VARVSDDPADKKSATAKQATAKPAAVKPAAAKPTATKSTKSTASAKPETPTFSEAMATAAKNSGFGQLKPGETPSAGALLAAIGGIRGVFESVLPGIAFLVLYLTTHNLLLSVLVPVLFVFVFAVARAGARSSLSSTIAGGVLLAISAVLVLITGKAVTNFFPGIVINVAFFLVLLITLLARWPLIGIVVGLLFGDATGWRKDAPKRRILTLATWLWVGLFAIRLVLEIPLYVADNVPALGIVRIITSVPLYALFLWVTWLLVRGVYAGDRPTDDDETAGNATEKAVAKDAASTAPRVARKPKTPEK
jgi:hypothetical protein